MMNNRDEELNRLLADWIGLEWDKYKGPYQYPFTTSFDVCSKLLIPKIWKEGFWVDLRGDTILGWDCRIHHIWKEDNYSIYQDRELPRALCLATRDLIDIEKRRQNQ